MYIATGCWRDGVSARLTKYPYAIVTGCTHILIRVPLVQNRFTFGSISPDPIVRAANARKTSIALNAVIMVMLESGNCIARCEHTITSSLNCWKVKSLTITSLSQNITKPEKHKSLLTHRPIAWEECINWQIWCIFSCSNILLSQDFDGASLTPANCMAAVSTIKAFVFDAGHSKICGSKNGF